MEGASEEFINVYEKMMHMFDCDSISDGETDQTELVKCVYKNFTSTAEAAMTLLKCLESKNLSAAVKNRLRALKLELRFLRTTFRCMLKWCIEGGIQRRLVDIVARIECEFVCATQILDLYVRKKFNEIEVMDFDEVVFNVLEKIKIMKPEIVEAYHWLFSWASPSKYPMISSKRKQVLALEEKLRFLGKFIWFRIDKGLDGEKLTEILIDVEAVADKTAGLCYFLWIDSEVEMKIDIKLIEPNNGQVSAGVFKALQRFGSHLPDEFQVGFFDCLQDNLIELLKDEVLMKVPVKNQIETLHEELRFLKDLFINLPILCAEQKEIFDVRIHIKDMARKIGSVICSSFNNENMAREISSGLSDFLENMKLVKAEVSEIFSKVLTRQKLKFPKVAPVGFFDFLFEDLEELTSIKSDMIIDLKDQILAIHGDIAFLRSFLQHITNHSAADVTLNDVVNRITVVAYEAEHLINLLLARGYPVWYQSLWISDYTEDIKLIKAAVMEIFANTSTENRINKSGKAPTNVVVGFKDEMELIKERLARGTEKLDIVSIVGMPGLGKTTLAKIVYEDPLIVDHFYVRAWCYVSPNYVENEMMLSILSSVIKLTDEIRKMEDDELSEMLYKQLKGRRYLIVMDDVWGIDAIGVLKRFFPDDSNGSRIMLTSRNKLTGSEAKYHSDPIELRLLTDDESWDLLNAKVFHQEMCPWELQQVGKQIAQKCNGLPLAVVVVAGLLVRSDKKQGFWEQVAENLSSHILGDAEGQGMEVLELSYKLLPDYLKPLFLYLGAFPVDKVIQVRKLTWLWIAEGFVQKTKLKSLEDEAEKNLMDLIDRSLVIIADRRSNGRVKTCRVHDLLRDLCLAKAKEENFLQRIHVERLLPDPLIYEHRRLSIQVKQQNGIIPMPCSPTVRSLLFFLDGGALSYTKQSYLVLDKMKLLRVLELESDAIEDDDLFADLQMLVHLRYFSVRSYCNYVPSSIAKLWNLETLIVKGLVSEIVVPDEIWKMAKLRHLHIKDNAKFILDDSTPENSSKEKFMGRTPNLRKLRCIFLESWDVTQNCNMLPKLVFLDQLESLNVLYHGMVRYPCEFDLPLNLKKLTLSEFLLPWNEISSFQKLPNLEVLKLLNGAVEGELWDMGDGDFPKLKFLKLESLNIKHWNASSDNFPCLEQLVLQRCNKLVEIPSSLGDICSLGAITVQWCSHSAAKSAKQIQEEQKDAGNDWGNLLRASGVSQIFCKLLEFIPSFGIQPAHGIQMNPRSSWNSSCFGTQSNAEEYFTNECGGISLSANCW
ncbi:hypothetical protein Pfo_023785 [Paulownia fortunei]|nr:hypothetical protein Pfo_023785 [Paulownia fortunei]